MSTRFDSEIQKATLWQMPGQCRKILHFQELVSTMDTALILARENCSSGTVVVAESQTKGRGRMTRTWHSETGGLYFTLILRPEVPLEQSAKIAFVACLTMAKTLNELFNIGAKVKWPNDLLVNDRKIAGMLSQIEAESKRISFMNIGIGLNLNNDPSELAPEAISLKSLVNKKIQRKEILFTFLNRLDQYIKKSNFLDQVIEDWKKHTITLGRKVKIVTHKNIYHGIARDIDSSGALIIELENGMFQTVLYGDCFHQ